jgi:uncharacterized protein DUF4390
MCYIGQSTRMVFKSAHLAASTRVWLAAAAFVVVAAPLSAQAPQGLRVVPVLRDEQVVVTFELRDGFTPDIRAAIDSGLKTTFTYTVDLRLDVPGWIDRTIRSAVVTNSVEYDNLRRMYTIERTVDGRRDARTPLTTDDAVKVREWLTTTKDLPLFSTRGLETNREYYVRVSATARPTYGSILWPFGSGTSAQTKFVFMR